MKEPSKILPPIIFAGFVLLIGGGVLVAWNYGAVAAYIGFAWVIPLAGIIWLKDEDIFGFLNLTYAITVIGVSLLALICFPFIVSMHWHDLTTVWRVGLIISALLHGFPLLLYLWVYVSVLIWGK